MNFGSKCCHWSGLELGAWTCSPTQGAQAHSHSALLKLHSFTVKQVFYFYQVFITVGMVTYEV